MTINCVLNQIKSSLNSQHFHTFTQRIALLGLYTVYSTVASRTELESCPSFYYLSPADLSQGLTTAGVLF